MSRKVLTLIASLAVLAVSATAAFAASPHYVQGPTVSVGTNAITISGKAAGLGNAADTADASLTGTIEVFSRCYNRGGNKPQADNKQETIDVNQNQTFDVRNGQVTFSFSVSPLSSLTCPGNQVVVVESVSYDLNLTWPAFPSLDRNLVG
jgi:hypothetical protein